ncbi:MAG: single-stranded DNA-binding protein [Oscillospiraceae bacterium]|nr:single-stranded DNA-binding protein [Oscillospiraceae bacterium]
MLNHIVIMGRLTRDPELRHTQSGVAVASFRLAVDRDFQSRDGGDRQADFIDVVAWRQTGEFVSKYFAKGRMAVVSGRLQTREWTDKDNNRRTAYEIVADNVYFGDSKRDGDSSGSYQRAETGSYQSGGYGGAQQSRYQQPTGYQGYSSPVSGSDFAELTDDDGDLPF